MNKAVTALILTCAILAHAHAFAGCDPVDLREALGPPRDQGETGWCYAHTAADLLTQAVGYRVSASAIASDFILARPQDLKKLARGKVRKHLAKNPYLLREIEEIRSTEPDHWLDQNLFTYEKNSDINGQEHITFRGLFDIVGTESSALVVANFYGLCASEKLPEENYVALADLLEERRALNPSRREFHLRDFVAELCGTRLALPHPLLPSNLQKAKDLSAWKEIRHRTPRRAQRLQAELLARIHTNLSKGRASAIGYDYCEHARPDAATGECSNFSTTNGQKFYPELDHSAIVAARKPIGGNCHFFLRNSVGATCEFTHTKWQSRCEAEAGGIWVTEEELESLYSVVSLP